MAKETHHHALSAIPASGETEHWPTVIVHNCRRRAILSLVWSVIAIAATDANASGPNDVLEAPAGSLSPILSQRWAASADDPAVAAGPDLGSMQDRLSSFFGPATGRYLTDQVIDLNTTAFNPGWDTRERLLYDQFVAIFRGAPEFVGMLPSGMQMVVRTMDSYKAAVFLDQNDNILSAALTFDFCPPDGVDQKIADGRVIHSDCLWPFSAVLFYKTRAPDPEIVSALRTYLYSLPMERERTDAARMTADGKLRIKVLGRRLCASCSD